MRVEIERERFIRALRSVQPAVGHRPHVLRMVHLSSRGEVATFTAANGSGHITATVPAAVGVSGDVLIDAKKFVAWAGSLRSPLVSLIGNTDGVRLQADGSTLRAESKALVRERRTDKSGNVYWVNTSVDVDILTFPMPTITAMPVCSVDGAEFAAAISLAACAASEDGDFSPRTNVTLLLEASRLRVAATDGTRYACRDMPAMLIGEAKPGVGASVPLAACNWIAAACRDEQYANVSLGSGEIVVETGNTRIGHVLNVERGVRNFYSAVAGQPFAKVNRLAILPHLRAMGSVLPETSGKPNPEWNRVQLSFGDGKLSIVGEGPDATGQSTMPAECFGEFECTVYRPDLLRLLSVASAETLTFATDGHLLHVWDDAATVLAFVETRPFGNDSTVA